MNMTMEFLYDAFCKSGIVCTDSRNIIKNSIFFALKGDSFDGNEFAAAALESGASLAVVDNPDFFIDNGNYALVDNCLDTLQTLANTHRSNFHFPVIGITGTNGKTTTKELISGALAKKFRVTATRGNFNNHIGVPLTLLSVNIAETDICVVEMGANHPGEIKELCDIADPTAGIITSIGVAHLEGFGSVEEIIRTKTALYRHVEQKSTDGSFETVTFKSLSGNTSGWQWLTNTGRHGCVKGNLVKDKVFVEFEWYAEDADKVKSELFHLQTQMYGSYNFMNMLAAICVATYFGVAPNDVNNFLRTYTPSNNRSQIKKIASNTVICDAYNANPSSMNVALDTFSAIESPHKMVILGDMFELGENSLEEHRKIVEKLKSMTLERVVLIGKNFSSISTDFEVFETTARAKEAIDITELQNKLILLKGSRGMKLESLL